MDNLALFFNQYGVVFTSLALFFAAFMGYGKLSQQTSANTKAIDELKGDVREIRHEVTNVRIEVAALRERMDSKFDLLMQLVEKKA